MVNCKPTIYCGSYFYNFNSGLFHRFEHPSQLQTAKFIEIIFSKNPEFLLNPPNVLSEKDSIFIQRLNQLKNQQIENVVIKGSRSEFRQIIVSLFCSPIKISGIIVEQEQCSGFLYDQKILDPDKIDGKMEIISINENSGK